MSGARRLVRIVVPALLIIAWVAAAGLGGPLFGKVDEVSTNDQTSFLPESADATVVQERLEDFRSSDSIPAVAIFSSSSKLLASDMKDIQERIEDSVNVAGVSSEVSPGIPSEDGKAVQSFIPLKSTAEASEVVPELTNELRAAG